MSIYKTYMYIYMCVTYAHTPSFIDVHGIPKGAGPRRKVNNTKQT